MGIKMHERGSIVINRICGKVVELWHYFKLYFSNYLDI